MTRSWWCGLVLLLVSHEALAQSGAAAATVNEPMQAGVVRGTVAGKQSGEPLAYAIITIESLGLEQFSNSQGRFYFAKVKPGKYRINIRQLGYLPANVDITVDGNLGQDVKVQLDRIATRLATVKVTEQQSCLAPGRPTAVDGEQIVEVFEQLEQSAVRLRLLAREFPYKMVMERRFMLRYADGSDSLERFDVSTSEGQKSSNYEPGKVVRRIPGGGKSQSLQVPTLLDFADPKFINNHCFTLRGLEKATDGTDESFVRVDFTASSKLDNPDVEGSVFLDSADYRLRRSEIRLTKVPSSLEGLAGVNVKTRFQDYVPGMPIVGLVEAVSEMREVKGKPPLRFLSRNEQQIPVRIFFTKQRPDSLPPARN